MEEPTAEICCEIFGPLNPLDGGKGMLNKPRGLIVGAQKAGTTYLHAVLTYSKQIMPFACWR